MLSWFVPTDPQAFMQAHILKQNQHQHQNKQQQQEGGVGREGCDVEKRVDQGKEGPQHVATSAAGKSQEVSSGNQSDSAPSKAASGSSFSRFSDAYVRSAGTVPPLDTRLMRASEMLTRVMVNPTYAGPRTRPRLPSPPLVPFLRIGFAGEMIRLSLVEGCQPGGAAEAVLLHGEDVRACVHFWTSRLMVMAADGWAGMDVVDAQEQTQVGDTAYTYSKRCTLFSHGVQT